MIGPAAIAWSSSLGWLPYGVHSTGIISPFINPTMGCGGATGYIGYAGWTNNSGFSGQFYGMVTFSQALTAAQVEQATAYGASLIQQNGGPAFTKTPLNFAAAYYGDSIMENRGGNNALGTSRPTYIAQAQPSLAPFTNFGVSGIQLADINSNNPPATALKANTNAGSTVALVSAGVNDIVNATCASAAACYATVQATPPSPALPNVSTVYATVLPAGLLSSGGETIREGLNSLVIAGALAGTFNFTGVDDIANDPIASTQTTPNSWGTTTSGNQRNHLLVVKRHGNLHMGKRTAELRVLCWGRVSDRGKLLPRLQRNAQSGVLLWNDCHLSGCFEPRRNRHGRHGHLLLQRQLVRRWHSPAPNAESGDFYAGSCINDGGEWKSQ